MTHLEMDGFSIGIALIMWVINKSKKKNIGYHNIFDHYRDIIKEFNVSEDTLNWHFHPMSTYNEAHRCATSYVNSPELYQILCRKLLKEIGFHRFLEQDPNQKDQIVIGFLNNGYS